MLLLGIDLGTSSIKIAIVDAQTQQTLVSVQYPETETIIIAENPGWAEQNPMEWWENVQLAILKANNTKKYNPKDIVCIGIAYQMHGLVCLDKDSEPVRNSIIWCDSRAVDTGTSAFQSIGKEYCLQNLLNSPGNFTAAKLGWVKENEPEVYSQIDRIMLPGDYIALKLTGNATTTVSALSEGIFWDFKKKEISKEILKHFGFDSSIIPEVQDVFSEHGKLSGEVASNLGLRAGIHVTYKAGDQPNNGLSLQAMEPGEVAANAGTSGVIYAVTDQLKADNLSRVNNFAHVNYSKTNERIGVLLCINGTGIANSWARKNLSPDEDYNIINRAAKKIDIGSEELTFLPFGNGAERIFENKIIGSSFINLDFNRHTKAHIFRAIQEGIACSFQYGLEIMKSNGIHPSVIRASNANLFLSELFTEAFVNITNVPVELFDNDGSTGAAIGAGIGAGIYPDAKSAFAKIKKIKVISPTNKTVYSAVYENWYTSLEHALQNSPSK